MKQPDFLCIGAQKAGTTWLHNNLQYHPEVRFPHLKELHYYDEIQAGISRNLYARLFDDHWKNGWWRDTLKYSMYDAIKRRDISKFFWLINFFFSPRGKYWYMSLFPNKKGTISGDMTPEYAVLNPSLIKRINKHFPDVKIILLLRNPIEREWSNIKMWHKRVKNVTSMDEVDLDFLIAQSKQKNDLSEYCETIKNWTAVIPKDRMLIRFFDEIIDCPYDLLSDVYSFLGIQNEEESGAEEKVSNKGLSGKMPPEIRSILTDKYMNDLVQLEKMFSDRPVNYVTKWIEKATQG